MKNLILKYTLINAIEHEGRADTQAVLGKVIAEDPSLKTKINEVIAEIKKTVEKINSLSIEEQKKRLDELRIVIEKKKIEKFELPDLPNVKAGKVITAFPPEPSKFPHIGHAKSALLNFLYAKKYKGRFILRFEDSNPELAKKEYYEAIIDGFKWLGIKWNKLEYLSDYITEFYKVVKEFISKGDAYVCLCKQKEIKRRRALGKTCEHREFSVEKNLELWNKMLKTLKEGKATVRLKIDMKHPNTTMRDPSIMRIVDYPHPRTRKKYRVWPVYDFGTALLDVWEKITHRVRSKEFEIRKELQQYIQKLLGAKPPYIVEIGRLNLEGVPSSGRRIREMIKKKELMGWDDPRLTTLIALKRRGFVPEGIKNFLISTGISKSEGIVGWEILEAENRKVIDAEANRYFAVLNPVKISVKNVSMKTTRALLHPDFPNRGYKKIPVNTKKIYIEKEDLKKFNGKEVGLMNLFSVKIFPEAEFVSKKIKYEIPKIHWVSEPNTKIKIIMSDGSVKTALAEPAIKKIKLSQLIQFVRIGFCRVDKIGKEIVLYFTHK